MHGRVSISSSIPPLADRSQQKVTQNGKKYLCQAVITFSVLIMVGKKMPNEQEI